MRREEVILVDELDRDTGIAEKLDAHRRGLLHRAFSVIIENEHGDVLLQRRAATKYHSPGLWSNAACGHPRPGETTDAAARRRLFEELGMSTDLREIGQVTYRARVGDLIEHEIDHVFVGRANEEPHPDPVEVSECRWISVEALRAAMRESPAEYTPWLEHVMSVASWGQSR